jgi:hypothetical protein
MRRMGAFPINPSGTPSPLKKSGFTEPFLEPIAINVVPRDDLTPFTAGHYYD